MVSRSPWELCQGLWKLYEIILESDEGLWGPWRVFGGSLGAFLGFPWGLWVGLGDPWGRSLGRLVRHRPVLKSLKIHWFLLYFETLELPKESLEGVWVLLGALAWFGVVGRVLWASR